MRSHTTKVVQKVTAQVQKTEKMLYEMLDCYLQYIILDTKLSLNPPTPEAVESFMQSFNFITKNSKLRITIQPRSKLYRLWVQTQIQIETTLQKTRIPGDEHYCFIPPNYALPQGDEFLCNYNTAVFHAVEAGYDWLYQHVRNYCWVPLYVKLTETSWIPPWLVSQICEGFIYFLTNLCEIDFTYYRPWLEKMYLECWHFMCTNALPIGITRHGKLICLTDC